MRDKDLAALVDHAQIAALMNGWGYWRDTCNWPRLADCYTADARMLTTWFDGSARDFITASQRMAEKGSNLQHFLGTPIVELHHDRATAATRVQLKVRAQIEGIPVDATCYGRFHDQLLRQDGQWRIHKRVPVYEKDDLRAVHPADRLALDAERLNRFPPHYQFLAYLQSLGGATITPHLPAPHSAEEKALFAEDSAWLQAATGSRP